MKNFNEELSEGTAEFIRFRGLSAAHIKNYVKSHLVEKPKTVIIQAGENDLPQGRTTTRDVSVEEIANHLIETGETCKRYGVTDISIGGVTPRSRLQRQVYALNDAIKAKCERYGFNYINNDNIFISHLYDGVHLNKHGSELLKCNYLNALNGDEI